RHRGIATLTVMGQAPHYLQRTTNPAMRQALLTTVARLLDLELDVAPLDAAVEAFRTRCDQAVAQDAATQAYVRQLEQAYDATVDEALRQRRDDDFNPEQLMHELEDFLRQERDRGAEGRSCRRRVEGAGQAQRAPWEAHTRTDQSSSTEAAWNITW